jgi:hypothetical protein
MVSYLLVGKVDSWFIFLYCPTCVEAVLLNGDDAVDCRVRGKAGPGGRSGGSGSRRDGETDWGDRLGSQG